VEERLGIAGSGVIACGLAAVAAPQGDVVLWARSEESATRARERLELVCARLKDPVDAGTVPIVSNPQALADTGRTFVIEAVAEDPGAKANVHSALNGTLEANGIVATTTSSLSVAELADSSGRADRFIGLHVFNPVPSMGLVELVAVPATSDDTRARARALCEALGKTPIEVPDLPGFVVNRLLFPYLFSAVRLLEESGLEPEQVDTCMQLGAGHPLGPLAVLDLVGLDVAESIAGALAIEPPARLRELVAEGRLGRKTGEGFSSYG
jgi:3-hydroxybutyryl-CoA dehydrogenase